MANRCLLHRNSLQKFLTWLGDKALPPVGEWEVARWKGKKGKPMCIIFDNSRSCEHLTCNDAASRDVKGFIHSQKASV